MVFVDKTPETPAPKKKPEGRPLRPRSLPSPALCCACGLCVMLAGINITLVGAFSFGTFVPTANPPIVIGPLLLLLALLFFAACCLVSRRPSSRVVKASKGGEKWELMRMGASALETETSEHTLQDTTAVQLSPNHSHSSSRKSSSSRVEVGAPAASQVRAGESTMSEVTDVELKTDTTGSAFKQLQCEESTGCNKQQLSSEL